MQLVPIPTTSEYLNGTFHLWSPFIPAIASRSPWSTDELLGKVSRHEVQLVLIWDDNRVIALLGITIVEDNGERVGELSWVTGKARQDWQHLLAELEAYLRDHVRCRRCRPISRPGWRKLLAANGYRHVGYSRDRRRHDIMEKVL
jgi:hypothetical protein